MHALPASHISIVSLTALCASLLAIPLAVFAEEDPLLVKSREISASFGMQLKAALQDAMTAGGPVAAITVCKDIAPQIASDLSRKSGAKVTRTSLRFRNPMNAPEPWQTSVLQQFEQPGKAELTGEYFEQHENNSARYMKAIPTGALCLSCHGSNLPVGIKDALDTDYPHDLARNYELGDIRGAFSITWPDTKTALK